MKNKNLNEETFDKKIAVAVSGGVDSSVALALLKDEGYDLVAVFTSYFGCDQQDNLKKAMENAEFLNVPFYKIDFEKDFKEKIVKPFIEYYERGLTPNPCVWCNSKLRFSMLMDKLKSMGIEYLATGHYARIINGRLFRSKDLNKDQSYFLYNIALENIIFPLGELYKEEVYKIARKKKFPAIIDRESQDCCILKEKNLYSFLKERVKLEKGKIMNLNGEILGEHPGYQNFTIGQRRGIGGVGKKSYVVNIDPVKNLIVVGDKEDLYRKEVTFKIENQNIRKGEKLEAKLRSTHLPAAAIVEKLDFVNFICKISFEKPQFAPTPGQSVVLYRNREVVGGGEIVGGELARPVSEK